jgi:NAD(P)-dependent dehydrogenase (short-subunit alcohol dehydrogenase family)
MRRFAAKLKSLNIRRNVAFSSLFIEKQNCGHLGGSRGLGLAMVREFARHRAHLALLARDAEELGRAAADLLHFNARVSTRPCDVREPCEVEKTISAIAEKYARIDVLVNNAGIMLVAPCEAMAKADFEEAMQVHFWAPYYVTMAALPHLRRNAESRVVNISSIGGRCHILSIRRFRRPGDRTSCYRSRS